MDACVCTYARMHAYTYCVCIHVHAYIYMQKMQCIAIVDDLYCVVNSCMTINLLLPRLTGLLCCLFLLLFFSFLILCLCTSFIMLHFVCLKVCMHWIENVHCCTLCPVFSRRTNASLIVCLLFCAMLCCMHMR